MKQEIWKWFYKWAHPRLAKSELDAVMFDHVATVFTVPPIEFLVYSSIRVAGKHLRRRKVLYHGGVEAGTLLASREIQRQLREKGVECVIRDSKTGEVL